MENNKETTGNQGANYRLSTMLPFDVFTEFLEFCKKNTITGTDKWDFGNGLRLLLLKEKYSNTLEDIENRLSKLENLYLIKQEDKNHG